MLMKHSNSEWKVIDARVSSSKMTSLKNEQSSCITKTTGMLHNNSGSHTYRNHFGVESK
jgi:hypothetical protein